MHPESANKDETALDKAPGAPKGEISRFISEGILIIIATAAAYIGSYYHESSYARHFNIPPELLTLSVNSLLSFGGMFIIIIIMGILCYYPALDLLMLEPPSNQSDPKKLIVFLMIKKWFPVILLSLFCFWPLGFEWNTVRVVAFFCSLILLILIDLAFPLWRQESRTYADTMLERLRKWPHVIQIPNHQHIKQITLICFLAVIWVITCAEIGDLEARGKTLFAFVGDQEDEVIVRRYGDILVLGKIEPKSSRLLPEFRLIKVDELKERVVIKEVSYLEPIKPTKRAPIPKPH